MKKWYKFGIVGLLIFGALAVLLTGTALAQDETPPPPAANGWHGGKMGFGRGLGGQVGLDAAAEALGMTSDELSTQLWGGKTLADLVDEAGVDLQTVRDAVESAQEAATRDAIQQAVEDGTITQDHANWLLEGLDNGYWGGFGGGPGGFHGRGFRGFGPSGIRLVTPSSGA